MSKSPIVLIDADSIVYRSAFAAQHTTYRAWTRDLAGEIHCLLFDKKGDIKVPAGSELLDVEEHLELEPVANVLSTVRSTIDKISDYANSDILQLYLTAEGGQSYRHEIAKQKGYKANRTKERPQYYRTIREYLQKKYHARVVVTREADDELSIQAHLCREDGLDYVLATIDKDLDQIPGEHYNYREQLGYYVGEEDAERWFWIQCLAGDPTDNVPGCWKIGQGKAAKIIDLMTGAEDDEIWRVIVDTYEDSQALKGCPYRDQPPEDVALETAQLVYLQQREGEIWMPPNVPRGRVKEVEADEF